MDQKFLTLIALYFVFGFLLQRGRFCGSALVSSAILYRDFRGLRAIALAILMAMLGFAFLAFSGTHIPDRPLFLFPAILGGLLFGVGMVLAGGCVSGTMYKTTEGRAPSMLSLFGILIGISSVGIGPGKQFCTWLEEVSPTFAVKSLPDLLGASYFTTALVLSLVGLCLFGMLFTKHSKSPRLKRLKLSRLASGSWPLWFVAIAIGLLNFFVLLTQGHYGLGATGAPGSLLQLVFLGEINAGGLVMCSIFPGALISAIVYKNLKWRSADRSTLAWALVGGVLLGIGAAMAHGCFIGQVLTGWALLSFHSLVFGIAMLIGNAVTTIIYLRGV